MAEKMLIILINVSFQFALIFVTAWLIIKILRVRSAFARYIIWLSVILCPLILVSVNTTFPKLRDAHDLEP